MLEFMGLQLPGSSFVNPNTPLRDALTRAAAARAVALTEDGGEYTPVARVVDEKALVNGLVGLLASGGSTSHTIHLVAIARAAGLRIDWGDFEELSEALTGGPLGKLQDGDIVRVDAEAGVLEAEVDDLALAGRSTRPRPAGGPTQGVGRELFGVFRANARSAEEGGSPLL